MGKAYLDDLRKRVVVAMAAGRSCREIGAAFDVAPSTAGSLNRFRPAERANYLRHSGDVQA